MDPEGVDDVGRVTHGSSDNPDVLDLSANVNPCVPAGSRSVYESAFRDARSYPNDAYPEFRAAAADYLGCAPEAVVPTAGGLAAIRLAIGVIVSPGDTVLVPYPSFGEYAREVRLAGAEPVFIPHDELLECDLADREDVDNVADGDDAGDLEGADDTDDVDDHDDDGYAMAVVCTPNNPTGDLYERADLEAFADRCADAGTVLLADEAFLGFTDRESLAASLGDRDSAVVARSLTKLFGLPGLRAGFAVAEGDLLERLRTARRAWSLGGPAAAVGAHVMRDSAFVAETCEHVASERERLRDGLSARGFDVRPSEAPFVLCDVGEDPSALLAACRERGVVLRDATTFRGLDSHVRIAVRDREATQELFAVLDKVR